MMNKKACSQCILDSFDDPNLELDDKGICNYCKSYGEITNSLGGAKKKDEYLKKKILEIKASGKGNKYDCLLGLSGGVDSSYMAYLAREYGLKPLVIHLDNGWNSDTAVRNIEHICSELNYDLYTYVIDWEEFVGLQKAYLKAGVIDIEVLTDHAIYAIIQRLSKKFKIKYSLSGFNYVTEAIMPKGWTYNKRDYLNIKDIVTQFGAGVKMKTFPRVKIWQALSYYWFHKLESFQILNYIPYQKEQAKELLKDKFNWIDYGGKHYESIFTKFYQAYILPNKFGVDKRKAHLSTLICSGQMNKEEAIKQLNEPLYPRKTELDEEKEYILKKLNMSEADFEQLMKEKPKSHHAFDSDQRLWERYFNIIGILKKIMPNAFLKTIKVNK